MHQNEKIHVDDGYVVGPPKLVFDAVRRFGERVGLLGLELQVTKSECYCPARPASIAARRPDAFPLGASRDDSGAIAGFGIRIGGVPVGDDQFVQQALALKVDKVVSKINTTSNVLRPLHLQPLHCSTYYGLTSLFHHRVRHCLPADVLGAAGQVDAAVLNVARACRLR